MPNTESTVGNNDCAKWTTEASTDKAEGSAESPSCAESPTSADSPTDAGSTDGGGGTEVEAVVVGVAAVVAPATLPRPNQMVLVLRDGYPTLGTAHCG